MPLAVSALPPLLRCCDNAVVFVAGGVPLFHESLSSSCRTEERELLKKSLSFLWRAAKLLCRFEAALKRAYTNAVLPDDKI